jgi:hypothetical protein
LQPFEATLIIAKKKRMISEKVRGSLKFFYDSQCGDFVSSEIEASFSFLAVIDAEAVHHLCGPAFRDRCLSNVSVVESMANCYDSKTVSIYIVSIFE